MPRTRSIVALGAVLAGCAPTAQSAGVPMPVEAVFPSTPPELGPPPRMTPPQVVERTLENGLRVLYVRQPELPVVSADLVVRGAGSADDPRAEPGLAAFTAAMLDEGAGGRGSLALADALDLLGADLSTAAGVDAARVQLYSLRSRFPEALSLLADIVTRPDFPAMEVERLREERLTTLARAKDDAAAIAANAFPALVFGTAHPYGRFETTEATRTFDRTRVSDFHARRYRPENATLILVGDVQAEALHPVVQQAFDSWRRVGVHEGSAPPPASPRIPERVVYLVDKPGAAQSEIRIGHPGVSRENPDLYALEVLNTIVGGSFTSRLNTNLREVHGWSYGARSRFDMRRGAGPFLASAAVMTPKTDSAVVEFFRELDRIRDEPVPAAELEKAKRYVALGFPRNFETTQAVAANLADLAIHGIDPSFFDSYVERVMSVTAEDVQRVARAHVRPDHAVVLVVGDRVAVEPGLRALGIGSVQVRKVEEFVR